MQEREVYEVVEHDGGWAYKVGATYSETFGTRVAADAAAVHAARAQRQAGNAETITYEDSSGKWHRERASGDDRPDTRVVK